MTSSTADSASEPIRLLVSGGGHRATLGSVGAVGYLLHTDRWSDVSEVVSVSGGSITNAALAVTTDDDEGTWSALASVVERIGVDRAGPFRTFRRSAATLTLALGVLITAALVVSVFGVGPIDVSAPIALVIGVLAFPVTIKVAAACAGRYFRDFIGTVSQSDKVLLSSQQHKQRQHIFCASGLSSATPYYLWTGRQSFVGQTDEGVAVWGTGLQGQLTVLDAAMASSALPGLATLRTPRSDGADDLLEYGELLVDGGASGIFGQQIGDDFQRTPADTYRSDDVTIVAVDAGRHVASPSPFMRRVSRFSMLAIVGRWLKVSLESTYVNDLVDLHDGHLVRCCELETIQIPNDTAVDPSSSQLNPALLLRGVTAQSVARPDRLVAERLNQHRETVATLGLLNANEHRLDCAVTVGFVGTMLSFDPASTMETIDEALSAGGAQLGVGDRLLNAWRVQ